MVLNLIPWYVLYCVELWTRETLQFRVTRLSGSIPFRDTRENVFCGHDAMPACDMYPTKVNGIMWYLPFSCQPLHVHLWCAPAAMP